MHAYVHTHKPQSTKESFCIDSSRCERMALKACVRWQHMLCTHIAGKQAAFLSPYSVSFVTLEWHCMHAWCHTLLCPALFVATQRPGSSSFSFISARHPMQCVHVVHATGSLLPILCLLQTQDSLPATTFATLNDDALTHSFLAASSWQTRLAAICYSSKIA